MRDDARKRLFKLGEGKFLNLKLLHRFTMHEIWHGQFTGKPLAAGGDNQLVSFIGKQMDKCKPRGDLKKLLSSPGRKALKPFVRSLALACSSLSRAASLAFQRLHVLGTSPFTANTCAALVYLSSFFSSCAFFNLSVCPLQ
jgi:hypothetical protein